MWVLREGEDWVRKKGRGVDVDVCVWLGEEASCAAF